MQKVKITTSGIKKALSKYDYPQAICEYIWNGFDADASKVEIVVEANAIGTISSIHISDNGYGISDSDRFKPVLESEKALNPQERRKNSTVHGKNGIGRLSFFTFSEYASWETVYRESEEGQNYAQKIEIRANTIDTFKPLKLQECNQPTGTTVTFTGIFDITQALLRESSEERSSPVERSPLVIDPNRIRFSDLDHPIQGSTL